MTGTHTYAAPYAYPVKVTISDRYADAVLASHRRSSRSRRRRPATVGGTVPATLCADARRAGVASARSRRASAKDYTASTTADVISTAGDAALTVADPAGHRPPGQRRVQPARSRCRPRTWRCRRPSRRGRRRRQRRRADRVRAADRRQRRAAHRHLRQDADVHACPPRVPSLWGVTLPEPFRWEDDQIAGDLPGARVVFSTRRGGVSGGAFDSLNLGLLTDDAPENVGENRARLGSQRRPSRGSASATAARSTARPSAAPPSRRRRARPYTQEDGQATALTDAAAIVFTADCLPVLLAAAAPWPRCTAAGARWPAGSSPRASQALRERRRRGADPGRHRPGRARLLLRGRRGGPRALRRLRRAPRRAQPRPRGRRRAQLEAPASSGPRHRPVHDLRRGASSRTAATTASPAARRGSCAAPDHRPRRGPRAREPRARARGDRERRARPGRGRDPRRGQVRAARGDRRPGRGRPHAAGGEPRPGPRGQGRRSIRSFRWHFIGAAAVAQGQADPPVRGADPLGRVRVRAAPARAARRRPRPRS